MQPILNEEDFDLMLSEEHSVIYFYVEWSISAVQGRGMLEELEASWLQRKLAVSFWLADVSDQNGPAAFLAKWLKEQERADLTLHKVIVGGSGSLVWLNRGKIVDFVPTAVQHDVRELTNRTESAFGERAT